MSSVGKTQSDFLFGSSHPYYVKQASNFSTKKPANLGSLRDDDVPKSEYDINHNNASEVKTHELSARDRLSEILKLPPGLHFKLGDPQQRPQNLE